MSYAHEPAGETHTLFVPEDVTEMITWFHVTGGYTSVDPQGIAVGYEDVFTKIEGARAHYDTIGLGEDYVNASSDSSPPAGAPSAAFRLSSSWSTGHR